MKELGASSNGELKEINLTDYLYVGIKWRRFIFSVTGVTFILTAVVMFLILPRWYKSTAVVMPPKEKSQFSVSSAIRNLVPFGGIGLGKVSDELSNYSAILKSRTCLEKIVEHFNLVDRYRVKNLTEAVKQLEENVSVDFARDDVVLEISVYDTDARTAADMANAFVEELNRIYLSLMTQEAKSNREFLGRRYEQNLDDLGRAEESLRDFQKKFGVYALPEQVRAAVQAAAELKSQVLAQEVEIGILQKTVARDDARIQRARIELSELNKQLHELKYGAERPGGAADVFSPFDKTPELGMQYIRHYRDVEVQQKLMEILLPLFEQAKIEEQRDTPTILILDQAVPAPKPAKPNRTIYTLTITALAFLFSIFLVFILDYLARVKHEIRASKDEKLHYIESQLPWRRFFLLEKSSTSSEQKEV